MEYCDECGPSVRAKETAFLASGGVLTYCSHHANKHRVKLESDGAFLLPVDETELQGVAG
jgi:hypothetical protein